MVQRKPRMLCLHHPLVSVSAPDLRSGRNAQRWVAALRSELLLASALEKAWSEPSQEVSVVSRSLSVPGSETNCARSDEDGGTVGRGEGDAPRPRVQSLLW